MLTIPCRIVERMLMHFPEHINFQKEDDGYSPLHVAVANKHLDVLELFLQQVGGLTIIILELNQSGFPNNYDLLNVNSKYPDFSQT